MLVRFRSKVPPYQAGEVAGFPDGEARRLIALGSAEAVVDETPAPPPEPEAAEEKKPDPAAEYHTADAVPEAAAVVAAPKPRRTYTRRKK